MAAAQSAGGEGIMSYIDLNSSSEKNGILEEHQDKSDSRSEYLTGFLITAGLVIMLGVLIFSVIVL